MTRSFAVPWHALLAAGCLLVALPACAQKAYPSADAAADAFTDAVRRVDPAALRTVLGADWKKFIPADNIDRRDVEAYLAAWDKSHRIEAGAAGTSSRLSIGDPAWTLPIPIVQSKAGWHFDPRAGVDELRTRRIGRNELAAMQAVLAYYDAQKDYALKDRTGGGVREYAQKFVSTPGKHDGLYWDDTTGQDESPLGPLFAGAQPQPQQQGPGYHGYQFKILKAQGKTAPGGAFDYVIGKRMRAGFALVAWPLRYGDTGVMSFMVSHDGTVVEKDLGPNTDALARAMTRFNPDPSWKKAAVPGT